MSLSYQELLSKYPESVLAINNILTEAAWFYQTDDPDLFYTLQHYESCFREFYQSNFGWTLRIDRKCARLVKSKVYNKELRGGIVEFRLRGRDEYIGFLLLIEFYEKLLADQSLSVVDRENPRFTFGEYLDYVTRRMKELFPERDELEADIIKKKILRPLMEKLLDYRFLSELPKEEGERIEPDKTIYEALPACYFYNAGALSKTMEELQHAD